ncbi:MAG: tricarboxylate transporter [Candidatus Tectimicrobiota bacterium]|nr:MAG: tricarboxylate transporter [Candidatus Tectomicrobia bacterium]
METFSGLLQGFQVALEPVNLAVAFLGVVLGLVIGILPGLGGTSGVAILLPLTVFIAPTSGIIFLASIYWGALFGGVITSILFNIPGEPWSVALLFDGYPLARKGRAGLALTAAFLASIFGALVAVAIFSFLMKPLAEFSLKFGPPEMFAIMLMAFATFVGLGGAAPLKTVIMLVTGLLLAMVGLDVVTGMPRFTFGTITLLNGFHFVPITIGLYGLGEILASAEEGVAKLVGLQGRVGWRDLRETLRELKARFLTLLGSTVLGFWVGILPGTGATPASFLGYGIARQYSKEREAFGSGKLEGVIAPQAAAQAAGIGALLPMITLGIPGSPTAAVLLAGLFTWGLLPGPQLFVEKPDFVWGLVASMYLGNFMALLICLLAVPLLAAIMRTPYAILTPFIVLISLVGSYVIQNSLFDVWLTLLFGLVGYVLKKLRYPLAPLVVALVLGDLAERSLRQSLIMADGSPAIFFTRPLSALFMALAFLLFLWPLLRPALARLAPRPLEL